MRKEVVTPSKTIIPTKSLLVSTFSFVVTVFSGANWRVPTFQRLDYYARGSHRSGGTEPRVRNQSREAAPQVFVEEFTRRQARVCTGVHTCLASCRSRGEREVEERIAIEIGLCTVTTLRRTSWPTPIQHTDRIASNWT